MSKKPCSGYRAKACTSNRSAHDQDARPREKNAHRVKVHIHSLGIAEHGSGDVGDAGQAEHADHGVAEGDHGVADVGPARVRDEGGVSDVVDDLDAPRSAQSVGEACGAGLIGGEIGDGVDRDGRPSSGGQALRPAAVGGCGLAQPGIDHVDTGGVDTEHEQIPRPGPARVDGRRRDRVLEVEIAHVPGGVGGDPHQLAGADPLADHPIQADTGLAQRTGHGLVHHCFLQRKRVPAVRQSEPGVAGCRLDTAGAR